MVRPPKICNFDNAEHPTRLDDLAEALGASKIDYYGETRCCGAALGFTDEEIMLVNVKRHLAKRQRFRG